MQRLAVVAAVLVMSGVAVSAEGGAPKGAQFVDSLGTGQFDFPSTSGWDIPGPGKEKVVGVVSRPRPDLHSAFDRQGAFYLWAKTCSAERQEVHFERDVYLPGPEHTLGATVAFSRGRNSGVFESARVFVNDRKVLGVGSSGGGFDRTDDKPKVFRFGNNHLDVVVVKGANPRPRECNRHPKPGNLTGVVFNITGELAGDVALPEQKSEEFYTLSEDSLGGASIPLDFEVRNKGPGGLSRARLNVEIEVYGTGEPHGTQLTIDDPEPPVHSCDATPPAGYYGEDGPRSIACTIANLRRGAVARQTMRIAFFMPGDASRTAVRVAWSTDAPEPPGAQKTDNERVKILWICRHDAGCPTS